MIGHMRLLRGASIGALVVIAGPALAKPPPLDVQARELRQQMQRRGSAPGEIHLALAAVYARDNAASRQVLGHLRAARERGIKPARIDLQLGTYYRRVARYDASFSTLVRVLVQHESQPYALVQLWKTLYEAKLRGAKFSTDEGSIRERLQSFGLHFPRRFKIDAKSPSVSRQRTAAGYNALLAGRHRFAAELFEAAIGALPSNAGAHRGLAIARARQQQFSRAAGAYLLYMELAPNARDANRVDRVLMEYWKSRDET